MARCRRRQDGRRDQPGQRRDAGHGADVRHGRNRTRHRRGRRRAARLGQAAGQGTRRGAAQAERPDAGQRRRPGTHHDRRAGQAAGRGQGRDRLCRVLHRVVRRRGAPRLRRHHPGRARRQAHPDAEAAGGHHRGDHAVELPDRDADPQGRPRAGGGLLDGRQAGDADALLRTGLRRTGAARRPAQGPAVRADRLGQPDRRRDDAQPAGAQAQLHRLDRSRPAADAPERRHHQEAVARTRRQRALHRLRRRRPGRCRRRRDDQQVP